MIISIGDQSIEIEEKRQALSISNLFFLGFDTNVAFYKYSHIHSKALGFITSLPRISQYCKLFSRSKSMKVFNKKEYKRISDSCNNGRKRDSGNNRSMWQIMSESALKLSLCYNTSYSLWSAQMIGDANTGFC